MSSNFGGGGRALIRGLRAGLCAALVVAAGRELRAEAPTRSPLVGYQVPAACPGAKSFSDQVAARTRLWQAATLAARVEIVTVPEGVIGRVSLERDGQRTKREIVAARCDEVVHALALIVAILIDPSADTGQSPGRAPAPAVLPAPLPAQPAAAPPRQVPRQRRWFAHAGAEFALEGGLAPGVSPGIRLFAGAVRRSPAAILSSLRLSGFRLASGTVEAEGDGSAAFELTGGRLEGCSFGAAGGAFRVAPCFFWEAGALAAEGTHPARSESETVFWSALGPSVRGSVGYRDIVFLELEAGAVVPLTDYRFEFLGQEPLFETPAIAPEFACGVVVRFP